MTQTKHETKLGFEIHLRPMTEDQYALVIPLPADRRVPDSEILQRLASHNDPAALIGQALDRERTAAENMRILEAKIQEAA
ncbi:MAG: hypothetical protein IID48_21890 [Proteobacteria bacterium]|nr:hypothetical protein [Pseudomonadota bacterium]